MFTSNAELVVFGNALAGDGLLLMALLLLRLDVSALMDGAGRFSAIGRSIKGLGDTVRTLLSVSAECHVDEGTP